MTLMGLVFAERRGKSEKTGKGFVALSVIDQGVMPRFPRSVEVVVQGEPAASYDGRSVEVSILKIDKNFDGSLRVGGEVRIIE